MKVTEHLQTQDSRNNQKKKEKRLAELSSMEEFPTLRKVKESQKSMEHPTLDSKNNQRKKDKKKELLLLNKLKSLKMELKELSQLNKETLKKATGLWL